MIIVPNVEEAGKRPEGPTQTPRSPEIIDPPPLYSPLDSQSSQGSTSGPRNRAPPNVKPSNFIRLIRPNSPIKGTYVVDPALRIPTAFLPPLAPDETPETRKNLSLESKNGSVEADIFIIPSQSNKDLEDQSPSKRLLIQTASENGSVITKVHDVVSSEMSRPPIAISAASRNGRVTVYLPRSFRGLVSIQVRNGSVRFSDEVQAFMTSLSDINRTQRGFLGHLDMSEWEDDAVWAGDELTIEADNGSVKVHFDDEVDPLPRLKAPGFFSRLFR